MKKNTIPEMIAVLRSFLAKKPIRQCNLMEHPHVWETCEKYEPCWNFDEFRYEEMPA